MSDVVTRAATGYGAAFAGLRPDNLQALCELFAEDASFRDPFNDVSGRTAIAGVFRHMFEACAEARFEVHEVAVTGDVAFYHWRLHYRLRRYQPALQRHIDGVSRVRFDRSGKVVEHVDHWDAAAQVYGEIPVLRSILAWLRRRLAA